VLHTERRFIVRQVAGLPFPEPQSRVTLCREPRTQRVRLSIERASGPLLQLVGRIEPGRRSVTGHWDAENLFRLQLQASDGKDRQELLRCVVFRAGDHVFPESGSWTADEEGGG